MATAGESLRTIDADGHVLEQLELDPEVTAAVRGPSERWPGDPGRGSRA